MVKFLFAVSTYKKNKALEVFCQTAIDNKMLEYAELLITDDDNGTAREVFEALPVSNKSYITGPNVGIAQNKNRAIRYFLEESDAENLILADDDIQFTAPGLLDEFERVSQADKEAHLVTCLMQPHDPADKMGHFHTFPVLAETSNLYWTGGSQGICCFYVRPLIEDIKYFQKWPYRYGFEHAEHSARALRIQGKCPEFFPVLKRSPKFIKTQLIKNEYDVDPTVVHGKQFDKYKEYLASTYRGVDLQCSKHMLDL